MTSFDYVIVGAGSAGCVLAARLSADPAVEVLLVEPGGADTNPNIAVPRGFGALLGDPTTAWHYPTRPFGPARRAEAWVRGKTLGGSSAVNGMVYNRGHRADYDALARRGNPGWGWDAMLPVFKTIEDNALGASDLRGAGGPLHVSTADGTDPDPLLEDVLAAGAGLGWRRRRDLNETESDAVAPIGQDAVAAFFGPDNWPRAAAFLGPVKPHDTTSRGECYANDDGRRPDPRAHRGVSASVTRQGHRRVDGALCAGHHHVRPQAALAGAGRRRL